jgi:hypothetical protein
MKNVPTVFYCEQCPGAELRLLKTFKTKKTKTYPSGIRVRRFVCDVCNDTATIFADGIRDKELVPALLIDKIKKMQEIETDSSNQLVAPIDGTPL